MEPYRLGQRLTKGTLLSLLPSDTQRVLYDIFLHCNYKVVWHLDEDSGDLEIVYPDHVMRFDINPGLLDPDASKLFIQTLFKEDWHKLPLADEIYVEHLGTDIVFVIEVDHNPIHTTAVPVCMDLLNALYTIHTTDL